MTARLIIFDFDGVLADTEELHCEALLEVLRSQGIEATRDEYFRDYLGLPDRDSLAAAFAAHGRPWEPSATDRLLTSKRAAYARRAGTARLYSEAPQILRVLHARHLLAIASGAFREEIEPLLSRDGVASLFSALVGADDVSKGKPSPEPFLRALDLVRQTTGETVAPGECLVVEDAPHGIQAARAAGMRCVAVASSHRRDQLGEADAVVDSLSALLQAQELR